MPLPPIEDDPYLRWRATLAELTFEPGDTALLVVDMQYLDADWESGVVRRARDAGFEKDMRDYRESLRLVVPNIRRLLDRCRERGYDVVFTKIEALTGSGRDVPRYMREHSYHVAPGSRDGQILDELAPGPDEIVLAKTGSSVFNGTTIDNILRNLRIENLVVVGVTTSGCVAGAVRDASDLGYACTVVEDACAAFVEEMHWAELRALRGLYSRVKTTDEVLAAL